ncbi:InlB B-repeat-containing protein [Paludibaculum fermentans]|uniref:InlB B-repeat-containing protein n=1 Tax=Paludibaculum fermentans TaxID=1473598 RepID=UPI003EB7C6A8
MVFQYQAGAHAAAGPDLAVNVARGNSFVRGQINATYLIRVINTGSTSTAGAITVTEALPNGISLISMSGTGWSCQGHICTRNDAFSAGQMLPTILVLASVAPSAPETVVNSITVSGGGDSDPTNNTSIDTSPVGYGGYLVRWGDSGAIGGYIPYQATDVVAAATGDQHAVALRSDGTLLLWAAYGRESSVVGSALTGVIAVAAGKDATCALKSDGSVAAWGRLAQFPPPPSNLRDVVSIAAASGHCLALKGDGTVVAWGTSPDGELSVPPNLTGVVSISTTTGQAIALKWDGSVVTWGNSAPAVPSGLSKLVRVRSVGGGTMAGVRADGTVAAWNTSGGGLASVPANLNHVVDLAGDGYVLAVKDDGSVVGWGNNDKGQTGYAPQLAHVSSIAGASSHAVAVISTPLISITIQPLTTGVRGPISVTTPKPAIVFDGISYSEPYTLTVIPGSQHQISTTATQVFAPYVRYLFSSWNIGGPLAQTVYPSADTTYSATFRTQFQLNTAAGTGGSISPGSSFLDAGSEVLIRAVPQAGYQFSDFTVSQVSEGNNPLRLTLDSAKDVTANFAQPASALLRVTLQALRPAIQGQQNAVYLARIVNSGTGPASGIVLQAAGTGLTVLKAWGTGWTCNANSCTRSDTLLQGQAYPAVVLIAAVDSGTGFVAPMVTVTASGPSQVKGATASSKVFGSANGIVAWGDNTYSQGSFPAGLTNLVDVSAGARHSLALRGDGTAVAWGDNSKLQTKVPSGLLNVVSIASGAYHNLALNNSGGVVAWGENFSGQATIPSSLSQVVAIAAGANHSLALTSSGTVVAWGANGSGQSTVPAGVTNAIAIAAGGDHSLAVLGDGSVVAWGSNTAGESNVPANLTRVVSVAAGTHFSMAVQDDGTVAVWGNNPASILSGIPPGLSDIRAVAAGDGHGIALSWSGTPQAWGANGSGQATVPSNLIEVSAVAGGLSHSLAISSVPAPISVQISMGVAGIVFVVDGVSYSSGQAFTWTAGSPHSLSIASPQNSSVPGVRYVFNGWSDIAAPASRTIQFSANYKIDATLFPQFLLTTSASTGGAITPSTGYVDADSYLSIHAAANSGYAFSGFSGDLHGLAFPRQIQIRGPMAIDANFVPVQPRASLNIDLRHTSAFLRGQTNAVYLLRVGNEPQGGPTSAPVQVTLTAPAGLQITSLRGPGWSCGNNSCSRSDTLAGGQYYPTILVLASIDQNAPASLALQASASGGGDPITHTALDSTAVNATAVPVLWSTLSLVETAPMPASLNDVVAVSVGGDHLVAVRKNGTVAAWGGNAEHQCEVPQGLTDVIAVAAGNLFTIALKSDGTVVGWGYPSNIVGIPSGPTDIVAIDAGQDFEVALRADGTVQYWGRLTGVNPILAALAKNVVELGVDTWASVLTADGSVLQLGFGNANLPPANLPKAVALESFAALAADGTLTLWGVNLAPPASWTGLARIALAGWCRLGQKKDGTILTWGCEDAAFTAQPQDLTNVTAIATGGAGAVVLTTSLPTVTYQLKSAIGGVTVDGVAYPSGQTFNWSYGSSHVIAVDSPTAAVNGQRSVFNMWTDGGAVSHTVIASSLRPRVIEAFFADQYYLTTTATVGGTITPPSGWYNKSYLQVVAKADPGYIFKDFSGILAGSNPTTSFYLFQPSSITAYFEPNGKAPVLSVTSTHVGDFTQGQKDAYYLVVVRNASGAGPTNGTVIVTNTLPAGLTAVSTEGNGWSCATATSCSRGDALAAGASYQPIMVKAVVSSNASSPQVNQVSVRGGGSASASNSDSTNILTLVNLVSNPPGLNVVADGFTYPTPKALGWAAGSSHTISISSPQGTGGTRRLFTGWSDSGAQSHTVTAGTSPVTYTANFKTQYALITNVLPVGAGSVTTVPSAADGWFDEAQILQVTASPAYAYSFTSFSNGLSGAANPQALTMSAPKTVTASFAAIDPHPSVISVSPSSGSGSPATLTAGYSAGLGYQNLAWVQLLVAAAPDGGGQPFCFIHYDVQGDSFWVYGDGGFFVGPVKRGTPSALLQNSFCGFNTKTSTVTGNGTALTLKADILFKAAGARNIYLRAYTIGELDTGWQLKGTWTTSAAVLGAMSAVPNSGSSALQTFAVTYADPAGFEGAPLGWMQFLIAKATDGGGQPFCFVHYDRAGNGLWMYSGDVGFFLGPVAPGVASNALDSSACSINTGTASANSQSGVLTLSVPVTLKAPMAGAKDLYQRMLDPLNRDSGWVKTGAWTIP